MWMVCYTEFIISFYNLCKLILIWIKSWSLNSKRKIIIRCNQIKCYYAKNKIRRSDLLSQKFTRATCNVVNWLHVEVEWYEHFKNPSSFSLFDAQSLSIFPSSSQSLCSAFSSGIKHNAFNRRWLFLSPSLAGSQTWVSSITRGIRFAFEDVLLTLFNGHGCGGWGQPES